MDLNKKVINGFQYYMKDKIGRGSSSEVFRGLNQKSKQQVAIKVISLQQGQREGHLEVAYAEINVLKKLKGHNNIVQLKNAIQTKNNVYIITQLCQKGTLEYEIGRGGKMDQARAMKIIEDVIEGYKFISAQGIIHRDLKPSNIFQNDKVYKIGDFGYAIESHQCENAKKQNVGSPLYMSPQSLSQNIYSCKSDIWAIGIIYYILLTGKSPWKARSQRQLITQQKHFTIEKNLPKNIGGLSRVFLQKTLQKNADERMSIQQFNRWKFNEVTKNVSSMSSLNSILEKPTLKSVRSITVISSQNNSIIVNMKSTGFLPTIIQNQPHDLGKVSQFNKQKTRQTADRTNNETLKTTPDVSLEADNKIKNKNGDIFHIMNFRNSSSNNIFKNQKTVPNFTSRTNLQNIISQEKQADHSQLKEQKFLEKNTTIRVISPPKIVTGLSSPRGSLNIASFQDRQRSLTQINYKQYNILTQVQAQINYFRYLFRLLRKICECLKTKQAKLDEFKNNLLSCIYSKISQIKQLKHIKGCTAQQKDSFVKSRQYLNILNVLLQYREKIEQEARKFELKIIFVTQRGFINNLSYVINLIYSNILQIKSNFNVLDKKKTLVFILEDLISLSDLFLLCCEQHWQNFRDKCKINDYLTKQYPQSIDSRYLEKVQSRFFELGKA